MLVIGAATADAGFSGTGTAFGTCGELVQGFKADGTPFHVTCPIEKTSTVTVTLARSQEFSITNTSSLQKKLELSLRKTAAHLDLKPCEIRVAHWTDLDVSKGMGSSTADIVAAARALSRAVGRDLDSAELAAIAVSIESSDGSMYPGVIAFNQKTGTVIERFDWWPQFLIVMVVPKRNLNTESVRFEGKQRLGHVFDELLDDLKKGSESKDITPFAEAATKSALLNQPFVPNPYFMVLEDKFPDMGALGINVGHTGTIVGLLYDATDSNALKTAAMTSIELQQMFPETTVEVTMTPSRPQSV